MYELLWRDKATNRWMEWGFSTSYLDEIKRKRANLARAFPEIEFKWRAL